MSWWGWCEGFEGETQTPESALNAILDTFSHLRG
jgi:hypothetical protein